MSRSGATLETRFWRHAKSGPPGQCWEWSGGRNPDGYGVFSARRGEPYGAHRVSWVIHNGPIPQDLQVLHHCDNPPCVNPAHLWLGTPLDNARDRTIKGRGVCPYKGQPPGEGHRDARLTADRVVEIRHRHAKGEAWTALAREFGLDESTVRQAGTGRTWRHIRAGLPESLDTAVNDPTHSAVSE